MTSSQEDFIVESTPVVDLKATGLVQPSEGRTEPTFNESSSGVSSLSHWDSEKTEVLTDADADAVAWLADETGQKFVIGKFPFFLGRSNECDVVLSGKGVSRKHAEIVFQSGRLVVNDLESLNGLKVNGYKVARVILEDNDEIRLGDVIVRFHTAASKTKDTTGKAKLEPSKVKKEDNTEKKSQKTSSISTADANAVKPNFVRYTAMVAVMASVMGLMYISANWYSKKRHVEEAILPAPTQNQNAVTENSNTAVQALVVETQQSAPPPVADNGNNKLAPPPPPSDSGSSVPPPAPFAAPLLSSTESVASASKSLPSPKPKKVEPIKVNRAELHPAPITGVIEAKKLMPPEEKLPLANVGDQQHAQAAQLLVSQADDRFMRGDAPALFKDMSAMEANFGLSSEDRGRVSRKLNAIQSLYSYYAEGKDAYAKGDKDRAFSVWAQFLAKERAAYPGKRSVYAAGVADTVSNEYVQQADAANKAGNQHDAYRLLVKASENGNSNARAKLDVLNMQAQNLYRDALRQEYVNSGKARDMWQKVVEMVPEENEYNVKASGKLAYYSRWGQ